MASLGVPQGQERQQEVGGNLTVAWNPPPVFGRLWRAPRDQTQNLSLAAVLLTQEATEFSPQAKHLRGDWVIGLVRGVVVEEEI